MVPIPLTDHIRRRTFWAFTLLLIVTNVWAFVIELSLGKHLNRFILLNGVIPARYSPIAHLLSLPPRLTIAPLFISMFLHGGWLHLLGNMLFLFVFGRSIEDRFGHFHFPAALSDFRSSGGRGPDYCQSGFPRPHHRRQRRYCRGVGRIFRLLPWSPYHHPDPSVHLLWTVQLPALVLLGYWFLIQFIAGFQMLSIQTATAGGVAWWAHIGGFTCGALMALIMRPQHSGPVVESLPEFGVRGINRLAPETHRSLLFSPFALGQINAGQDQGAADQHL